MKTLAWYEWLLFGTVVLIALVMSWYSVLDLTTTYWTAPLWLGAVVSTVFDIGALFMGLMSIKYARTQDSGFWTEVSTFGLIGISVLANVQHALLAGYGPVGAILFGAAPVVLAIMLKVVLNFLNRQAKRESGRVVEKLPSVGWFAWLRYRKQTWTLMSVAVQKRLIDAADRLDMSGDKHGLFSDKMRTLEGYVQDTELIVEPPVQPVRQLVQDNFNTAHQLSETPRTSELTSGDKIVLPVWLPNEPLMSVSKIVSTCVDNNVRDYGTILAYARDIKGHAVNEQTVRKSLYRAIGKVEGLA